MRTQRVYNFDPTKFLKLALLKTEKARKKAIDEYSNARFDVLCDFYGSKRKRSEERTIDAEKAAEQWPSFRNWMKTLGFDGGLNDSRDLCEKDCLDAEVNQIWYDDHSEILTLIKIRDVNINHAHGTQQLLRHRWVAWRWCGHSAQLYCVAIK